MNCKKWGALYTLVPQINISDIEVQYTFGRHNKNADALFQQNPTNHYVTSGVVLEAVLSALLQQAVMVVTAI